MRFTIKYKLLLTLLLTTIVVVVSMVFLIKWSFERGFLEYVTKVEQELHSRLVSNLAEAYRENGSWIFIRENPRQWKQIHRSSLPAPEAERIVNKRKPPPQDVEGEDLQRRSYKHHGPPSFWKYRHGRECVLDEKRIAVTPCRFQTEQMQLKKITVDAKTVGYLAVAPRKKLSERHDLHFSEQQQRFLLILGFCIVLISVVIAIPVSRQLVKPIGVLEEATRKLAAGQYQTRVKVSSSDELGELSRDFNSLAMTLEHNEQARQQWIADISHELRTPLSVLRGELEALQDGLRELNGDRLASLHHQVMNLNRLVNDLYELSMSDIGALNYQKKSVDVVEVLERCVESLRDEYTQKNISIHYRATGIKRRVFADTERLQQLFSNVLINSLRYTNSGGELRIAVQTESDKLHIIIEDSAPDVAEDDLPHLFERLYRVEHSRSRQTGGTGLGLAICKNIVDAHDGRITVSSSSLGGIKISIQLPLE